MYNQIYQGAFSAWRIGSWMTPYKKRLGQLWWWRQQIDLKVLCMQMVCKWGDTSICGVWVFGPLAPLCMMKLLLWSTWLSLATFFPIEKECESPQAKEQHLCRLHRAARLFPFGRRGIHALNNVRPHIEAFLQTNINWLSIFDGETGNALLSEEKKYLSMLWTADITLHKSPHVFQLNKMDCMQIKFILEIHQFKHKKGKRMC